MAQSFQQLLDELKSRGEELGVALAREQELEDDRAAIKADAIVRIMERDECAATRAEKVVETDEEYFKHRAKQRASIVARFRADAEYEAAKAAATQASLITPSVVELSAERDQLLDQITHQGKVLADLNAKLTTAKRETDLKEIALRRANSFLSHRINDVDDLTEANRALSARLGVEPRTVPFDTLDKSRDSLTAVPYTAETA